MAYVILVSFFKKKMQDRCLYLIVVSLLLPAAPFFLRRRYLAVVSRPLHAAPLAHVLDCGSQVSA
jgi:hypothetical protein